MAIVAPYRDQLAIYESTIDKGLGLCLHAHRDDVKGVQVHPIEGRLKLHLGHRGGRAWRLPWQFRGSYDAIGYARMADRLSLTYYCELIDAQRRYARMADRLSLTCQGILGYPYDLLGAFQARSLGFGWTRHFRRARPDANRKFYCNEFALHVYQDMGWLPDDVIPSKENPKSTVALLVKRGICGQPEEILL